MRSQELRLHLSQSLSQQDKKRPSAGAGLAISWAQNSLISIGGKALPRARDVL